MSYRLLIAEDNPTNMKILLLTLEGEGYDITTTEDGDSAWELINRSTDPFSVIILDWMMPGLSGLELLIKIKNDHRFKNIPIIIQTAKAQRVDIEQGMKEGAFKYLTKPYDEDVLLAMVKAAIVEFDRLEVP